VRWSLEAFLMGGSAAFSSAEGSGDLAQNP
jgi:hypothetical protein